MTEQMRTAPSSAVDELESVLGVARSVLEGVGADDWLRPTPCPDFDVTTLVDHILAWSATYADRVGPPAADEPDHHVAEDGTGHAPALHLQDLGGRIVAGYRTDTEGSRELPVGIVLLDYLGHTWDLAVATGQSLTVPEPAVRRALEAGAAMLTPENRGESFGPPVETDAGATDLERLVAFLGRDPRWTPPAA